jgi:hypothetical protein
LLLGSSAELPILNKNGRQRPQITGETAKRKKDIPHKAAMVIRLQKDFAIAIILY